MSIQKMIPRLLGGMLILQWLFVASAFYFRAVYLGWVNVPIEVIKASPEGYYYMGQAYRYWWMLSGMIIGILISTASFTVGLRKEIAISRWPVKLQLIGLLIPLPLIVLFGKDVY